MVKIKQVNPKDLIPFERNFRKRKNKALEAVITSIKTYGYNVPVLIDENNVIIAGHLRTEALIKMGIDSINAVVVENISEDEKDKLRLLDNAISEASGWDMKKLGKELRLIKDGASEETWSNFSDLFNNEELDKLLKTSLGLNLKKITDKDLERAKEAEKKKIETVKEDKRDKLVQCPHCGNRQIVRIYEK